jgi:transketolase
MVVLNPADGVETKKCIQKAAEYKGPVYIRLGRSKVPVIFEEDYDFQIGKGAMLKDGKDVTIIATGIMVAKALEAREFLEKEGISARVINISTIKPIDKDIIIKAAKETKGIVTAEEHSIIGGLGSAVAEVVVENCPVKVERIGVNDTFGESGTGEALLEKYGLTAENICEKAKKIIKF